MYNISRAVEDYNKHKDNKMTLLNIETLIKDNYLKEKLKKTSSDCEYSLTDDKYINCKKHGKHWRKAQ